MRPRLLPVFSTRRVARQQIPGTKMCGFGEKRSISEGNEGRCRETHGAEQSPPVPARQHPRWEWLSSSLWPHA